MLRVFMVNVHVFGCLGVSWGVVGCHGVISSTGFNNSYKLSSLFLKNYYKYDILVILNKTLSRETFDTLTT